ncbi:hypothetical protein [Jannaschia seohaensis]|uniref:Uncharacterized protein n=1 Tax=Jannaschia seohaensis TaxID=475081 RepID=A0A2Y9AYK0_9RHOB|nr:hypothetical protein [Jannaschia seohaensis]PWJ17021.1 hypothetical protein BCF38_107134 [Jannaschia seohaensis]SSA48358.1 hypothetical protein SAMN05421539_107134 [Jannaschia seohaensis]
MSYKRPHRHLVIDREFPIRLTVAVLPEQRDLVQRALARTVGAGNYGVTPATLWSGTRAHHLHLRSVYDALIFLAACPQARLVWEPYEGHTR